MSRALSPEDVLRLRFIRDARISPDGHSVAYALSYTNQSSGSDRMEIRIREVDSGRERVVSESAACSSPRWSASGDRLAFIESGEAHDELVLVDVRDGKRRKIQLPAARIRSAPAWSPDGSRIALVLGSSATVQGVSRRITSRHYRADGMGFTEGVSQRLCLLDVASGDAETLVDHLGFYSNIEWDDAGERVLFLAIRSPIPFAGYSPALYSIRVVDREISTHLGGDWFISAAKWLPGGQRIAVLGAYRSPVTIPTSDLWVVDCDGSDASCRSVDVKGQAGFRIHHDMPVWDMCWLNGLVIKDAESAWLTVQRGGRAEICEVSLTGPTRCQPVVAGERSCVILDAPVSRAGFLFFVTDILNPPDLFMHDGRAEQRLTQVNQDVLEDWPALRHRQLRFKSAEGMALEGWFLANGSDAGPHPTVMFIHGGPFIASGHAFRFDLHMLASHGIGVLFANFRGSYGYGEGFAQAVMGDWGARGFPDHMAAVDCAVQAGLADPERLGVWGASHGGFATCWIVGHTDRFRAAVAEAAVTNFTTAYYLSDAPQAFERDLGGKPHEVPDVYRSRSPLTYAHRCKTPTLMLHGEQDLRCPIVEAEQFHAALLDAGCIAEMVRLRDANHMGDSIGPPETRVAQNVALLDWFKRHL